MDENVIHEVESTDHIAAAEQNYVTESKNAPTIEQPILRVEHLKKYFPIQTNFFGKPTRFLKAVDDITFDLNKGKTIGVVGESGCGKTTLGRTILKLYESDGGKIYFMGNDITDLKKSQMMKYRTDIQLIFQDPYSSLPPRMTVGAIIAEPVRVHKIVPKNEVYEYVLDIMKKCGLKPSYYDRYPHEFSGGQRQRICIARALAVKPKLVICDEPVSALDVSIQAQIINLLKDLQKNIGLTYVFISHDLSVVKYITDNILVMYLGNAMELSETEELFDNPLHPYTQALFSAVPAPNPKVKMNRIMLEGDIPSPANPPAGCKFHTRCSKCMKVCKFMIPEYTEAKPDHFVACHLYNEEVMANLEKYDAEYDRLEEEKRIAIELAAQNKRGRKAAPPPEQSKHDDVASAQESTELADLSVNDVAGEAVDAYSQVTDPIRAEEAVATEQAKEESALSVELPKEEPTVDKEQIEAETVKQTEDSSDASAEATVKQPLNEAEKQFDEVKTSKPTKKSTSTKRSTAVKSDETADSEAPKAEKKSTAAKSTGNAKNTSTSKSTSTKKSTATKTAADKADETKPKTTKSSTAKSTATKATSTSKSTSTKKSTATKTTDASKSASTKKSTSTKSTKKTAAESAETPGEDKS